MERVCRPPGDGDRRLAAAWRLFAEPASAWGALYAFESQQPGTSEEKLKGLADHYGVAAFDPAAEYFRVHSADYREADQIVTAYVAGLGDRAAALDGAAAGEHYAAIQAEMEQAFPDYAFPDMIGFSVYGLVNSRR